MKKNSLKSLKIMIRVVILGLLLVIGALCVSAEDLSAGVYTFESVFHEKKECKKTFLNNDCSAKDALSATASSFTIEVQKKTGLQVQIQLVAIKGSCGNYLVGSCGKTAGFTSKKAAYVWEVIPDKKLEGVYRFQLANAKCSESFLQVETPKSACGAASLVFGAEGDSGMRFKLQKKNVEPPAKKPAGKKPAGKKPAGKKPAGKKPGTTRPSNTPTCTDTQYLDSATKKCKACTTSCGAGKYVKTACSKTADAVCADCSKSCSSGQYVDKSACVGTTTTNGAVCSACTTSCGAGKYIKTACSRTGDTVCSDCTRQCAADEAVDVSACTGATKTNGAVCVKALTLVFDTTKGTGLDVALPLTTAPGGTAPNVKIYWGDDSPVESLNISLNSELFHSYATAGTYTVKVTGSLSQFGNGDTQTLNINALVSVLSFGNLGIKSFSGAFNGATNLESVPATFPSTVTDTSKMFFFASNFNGDISGWDVSKVTNMSGMFGRASNFNGDISGWKVSKVTDMSLMFFFATSFNSIIKDWTVSSVTDMVSMFEQATSFNSDISGWDVSNVIGMYKMFADATAFTQDISGWTLTALTSCGDVITNSGLAGSECTKVPPKFFEQSVFQCVIKTCP